MPWGNNYQATLKQTHCLKVQQAEIQYKHSFQKSIFKQAKNLSVFINVLNACFQTSLMGSFYQFCGYEIYRLKMYRVNENILYIYVEYNYIYFMHVFEQTINSVNISYLSQIHIHSTQHTPQCDNVSSVWKKKKHILNILNYFCQQICIYIFLLWYNRWCL